MIRNKTNYYYYFRKDSDDRLDFDFFHPNLDILNNLDNLTSFDVVCLDYVIENIVSGKTPKDMTYIDDGVIFLGATNISKYGINLDNVKLIDESYHNSSLLNSKLKRGDVLVTIAGTIGNCALFDKNLEVNINQAVAKLELNEKLIIGEYLVKYLNSYFGLLNFKKLQHEVSQPNINLDEIKQIKLILPPLDVQKKIVDSIKVIENNALKFKKNKFELYSMIDNLFLNTFGFNKDFNEFYLFKNNKSFPENFHIFIEDITRLDFSFFYHNVALDNLKKNNVVLLKDICKYPIEMGVQPTYSESGIILLKTSNIKGGSFIDYENVKYVSEEFYNSKANAHVTKGNILVSSAGYGSIGKVGVYDLDESSLANHKLLIINLKEEYDPYFVSYFLESKLGQIQFDKWVSGSSGQIQLYARDLGQFVIPDIPLSEQKSFVDKIRSKYLLFEKYDAKFKKIWEDSEVKFEKFICDK